MAAMCSTPRITFCGWKSPVSTARLAMFLARSPIRSRSLATRSALTTSRRSTAIGWRRAMVSTPFSSISCCKASTLASISNTRLARSASRLASAPTASAICFSARPPISATMRVSSCRSTSKALAVCSFIIAVILAPSGRPPGSAEAAGHVVLFELVDQLLDLGGRDRVERRARLVEQDHLGLDGDGARDAQPLLLAAGKAQPIGGELVLHLVPQRRTPQRGLDPTVELRPGQLL